MAGTLYVLDGMTQQTKFGPRGFVQFRAIRIGTADQIYAEHNRTAADHAKRFGLYGSVARENLEPEKAARKSARMARRDWKQRKSGYQMLGQMEPDAPGVAALMGRLAEYRINADDSSIRYMLPPTPLADLIATLEPWDRTNSFKLGIKTKEAGKPGDRVEPSSQPTVIDQYTGLKSRLKRPSSDA